MAQAKRGLGRGLSALIPTDDMDFLAGVARGDFSVLAPEPLPHTTPVPASSPASSPARGSRRPDHPAPVSRETTGSQQAAPTGAKSSAAQGLPTPAATPRAGTKAGSKAAREKMGADPQVEERGVDKVEVHPTQVEPAEVEPAEVEPADMVRWVEPELIEANPYQPRRAFDEAELSNLSESIREHGVLQPIIVRPFPAANGKAAPGAKDSESALGAPVGEKFQLIAGERRWRACKLAGLERVPVVVRMVSDQQALELAIIENVQRHDISSLDAALAYRRLAHEFGLSQERIAQRVGKSRPSVANTLRLLELPPEAQQALQDGVLSEGHGRAILLAPGEGARRATLRAILRGKLSVREAEEMARRISRQAQQDEARQDKAQALKASASPSIASHAPQLDRAGRDEQGAPGSGEEHRHEDTALEERLQRALSCRVQVRRRRQGGQIVLFATDQDQLERLTLALQKNPRP